MNYYYNMSYDQNTDTFFAYVDDGGRDGQCVFTIDDTNEISTYIESGTMDHIDDVDGLEEFLKDQKILKGEDCLLLREGNLW
jgi:regulatory protein YycI of two-component signal transduction system YycFG